MALSNFTLTVSEYCSLEQLPAAFGWHMIGKAVFVTAFGPLIGIKSFELKFTPATIHFPNSISKHSIFFVVAGLIRDKTQSYPICIHAQTFW